jgi:hypothetical protein
MVMLAVQENDDYSGFCPNASAELFLAHTPIKQGATGTDVKRIQEWLCIHEFNTDIDQDFGPHTAQQVRAFQQAKGLQSTGIVEEKTYKALVTPLEQALNPIQLLARDTLPTVVLRYAEQHLKHHPIELTESGQGNCGPWVRVYMDGNDGHYWYWCAGFVTFVVRQACRALRRSMPIPRTFSCAELGSTAIDTGTLVSGDDILSGQVSWSSLSPCAIFLRRDPNPPSSRDRWTHTGFCIKGNSNQFLTIEGNANDDCSANGYEVCQNPRYLDSLGYDFIRLPQ